MFDTDNRDTHMMDLTLTSTCSGLHTRILLEFWLNQNTYSGGQGDLLAQAQVRYRSSCRRTLVTGRVVKLVPELTSCTYVTLRVVTCTYSCWVSWVGDASCN